MNPLLVAAVLISSLALVRADPADAKLVQVLNNKGFKLSEMSLGAQTALKVAMDNGKGVTDDILVDFTHVFYYTTKGNGELVGSITQRSGNAPLILPGAIPSADSQVDADHVFILSADNVDVETALSQALKPVLGERKFEACVESGVATGGLVHHVLAFVATE